MEILQLDHYIIIRRKMYFRFFLSFLTSIQFIRMIKGKDRTCQHPFPSPLPPPVSSFRLYHRSGWRVIKTINTWRTRVLPEGGRGEGATRRTETQGEEWREAACMHIRGCIEYNWVSRVTRRWCYPSRLFRGGIYTGRRATPRWWGVVVASWSEHRGRARPIKRKHLIKR